MTNKPMKVPGPEHPIDITPTKGRVTVEVNGIRIAGTGAADLGRPDRGGVMLAVAALAVHIEMKSACRHLALNRGFVYRNRSRHRAVSPLCTTRAATTHPLALSSAEQDRLIGVLDSERFADIAPATLAR
jgi:hypothetical protein